MKLQATLTINLGLYMDIRPVIEIDTENYQEARTLIKELHKNFFGLLNGQPDEVDMVNMELASRDDKTQQALKQTDWQMQNLFDKVRKGETIPVGVWQKLTPSDQSILHKAQLQFNQEQRLNKKDDKAIQNPR